MSDDGWKSKDPYTVTTPERRARASWSGACHCGRTEYHLTRARPLASKYCHCGDCKKLHGAPFQWAAIFHKGDMSFTSGAAGLAWYDSSASEPTHRLPCKVYCAHCRTPLMDEGRNMVLLFPTLVRGVTSAAGREAFRPSCHIFYPQRVVDFAGDGLVKWAGLDGKSEELGDDGEPIRR